MINRLHILGHNLQLIMYLILTIDVVVSTRIIPLENSILPSDSTRSHNPQQGLETVLPQWRTQKQNSSILILILLGILLDRKFVHTDSEQSNRTILLGRTAT